MRQPSPQTILLLQIKLIFVALGLSAILSLGQVHTVISTALGGLIAFLPAKVYKTIAYRQRYAPPLSIIQAHFKAQCVKFLLTVTLFYGVWRYYTHLSTWGLFLGFGAAISGYWLGLLLRNKPKSIKPLSNL